MFDFNLWHQEHLNKNSKRRESWQAVPPIVCMDGFKISVQASHRTYCTPRADMAYPYHHVECGFPSERVEELMNFAEDHDHPLDTVYKYVPVGVVNNLITRHGGVR